MIFKKKLVKQEQTFADKILKLCRLTSEAFSSFSNLFADRICAIKLFYKILFEGKVVQNNTAANSISSRKGM